MRSTGSRSALTQAMRSWSPCAWYHRVCEPYGFSTALRPIGARDECVSTRTEDGAYHLTVRWHSPLETQHALDYISYCGRSLTPWSIIDQNTSRIELSFQLVCRRWGWDSHSCRTLIYQGQTCSKLRQQNDRSNVTLDSKPLAVGVCDLCDCDS